MQFAQFVDYLAQLEATTKRNAMVEILSNLFKDAGSEEIDKIIYLCQERLVPAYVNLEFGIGEQLAAEALSKASGRPKDEVTPPLQGEGRLRHRRRDSAAAPKAKG